MPSLTTLPFGKMYLEILNRFAELMVYGDTKELSSQVKVSYTKTINYLSIRIQDSYFYNIDLDDNSICVYEYKERNISNEVKIDTRSMNVFLIAFTEIKQYLKQWDDAVAFLIKDKLENDYES